jgi:hypothetical protein
MKTLEDIILTVPSITDRGRLLSEVVKMRSALRKQEEAPSATPLESVANWLDQHWSEGTVRAKAIRKVAKILREQGMSDNPRA